MLAPFLDSATALDRVRELEDSMLIDDFVSDSYYYETIADAVVALSHSLTSSEQSRRFALRLATKIKNKEARRAPSYSNEFRNRAYAARAFAALPFSLLDSIAEFQAAELLLTYSLDSTSARDVRRLCVSLAGTPQASDLAMRLEPRLRDGSVDLSIRKELAEGLAFLSAKLQESGPTRELARRLTEDFSGSPDLRGLVSEPIAAVSANVGEETTHARRFASQLAQEINNPGATDRLLSAKLLGRLSGSSKRSGPAEELARSFASEISSTKAIKKENLEILAQLIPTLNDSQLTSNVARIVAAEVSKSDFDASDSIVWEVESLAAITANIEDKTRLRS